MAFTDNPVVSSLMDTTGLNDLLASNGDGSSSGSPSPIGAVSSQVQSSTPKSPQMRPEYQQARPPVNPRFAGPQAAGGYSSASHPAGVPQTEGVMSADTLQSPTVHDLLGYYGVSAPQGIDDHLFIHDPQAFAKHPMISGMIENGLGGLANYHTGQDTAQTLSNIAGSVLGNQAMHQQAYNARAMAPIAQAQQVGSLMENQQRMALQKAQQDYDEAHQKWYQGQFDNAGQVTQARTQLLQSQQQLAQTRADAIRSNPNSQLTTAYHDRLKALGNGDESSVDPDTAWKLYTQMQSDASVAGAAGKNSTQNLKNQGNATVANIHNQRPAAGGRGGGIDPLDQKTYNSAGTAAQQLQKQLDGLDRGVNIPKDEFDIPLSGADLQGYRQKLQGQIQGYQKTQNQIRTKYRGGSAAPSAPSIAPVSGNPYRP